MQKVFQTVDFATGVVSAEFYFPDPVGVGVAPGDYDGDGLVDYAFYRPSGLAGQSRFVVRSSATGMLLNVTLGAPTDYAVGSWDAHGQP